MLNDIDSLHTDTHRVCDICIVGSGPAGISLALEMIDSGKSVILLESGKDTFDQDTQNLYTGKIDEDLPPIPLTASRLRYFGGTSGHWAGNCGPLDMVDLEKRDWIKNSGWPISHDTLNKYYRKSHKILQLGPFDYSPNKWNKNGSEIFDFSDSTNIEHKILQLSPLRFGSVYREKLKHASNIDVIFNANLTYIHVNENYSNVTSIEVRSLNGTFISITPNKLVLATGGVENARLLLNSGLDKRNPMIGRYFSFHPRIKTGTLFLKNSIDRKKSPYQWQSSNNTSIKNLLTLSYDVQRKLKIPNHAFSLNYTLNPSLEGYEALKRLKQRSIGGHSFDGVMDDMVSFFGDIGAVSGQYMQRKNQGNSSTLSVITYMDQIPNKESKVTLQKNVDKLGMRKAHVKWKYYEEEKNMVKVFNTQLAIEIAKHNIGRMKIDEDILENNHFEEMIRLESGGGHQMGTTRMGQDMSDSVVDLNCKMHGIDNLYCLGSSVFPTTGWVNPTLTIVALSIRLADYLKDKS